MKKKKKTPKKKLAAAAKSASTKRGQNRPAKRNPSAKSAPTKKAGRRSPPASAIKQLTTKPTETDLETAIDHALRIAFPWISATDLKHQVKFSFNVGHAVLTSDGEETYRAEGRADIIVEAHGTPVAVMELKRRGIPLAPEDGKQGLSYAGLLERRPPLVVVTNGDDVKWLETHTRNEWKPSSDQEAEFAKLVESASRAAALDIKEAVQVLLGTKGDLWAQAMRQATAISVEGLTGTWSDPRAPFAQNFLIPREATQNVLVQLRGGTRAVILAGAPLSGKTNVLAELASETERAGDLAVLFIDAEDDGPGLFQEIANLLGSTLAWPVSADEVRNWLRRLSKAEGPALVLAIDGPGDNSEMRRDMTELCSPLIGKNVKMVVALDDAVVPAFLRSASTRKFTALGRTATLVEVAALNDDEFVEARQLLWDHRIGFERGVFYAEEMREPWILRTCAAMVAEDPSHANGNWAAILPPMLGLNLIAYARNRFDDPELRRKGREVAKAVLKESRDQSRAPGLVIEAVGLFMVRAKTLEEFLTRVEIDGLISTGVLKPRMHDSGDAVLGIYLPELLASELSRLVADELATQIPAGAALAAKWLAEVSTGLPLGAIIAAQAIIDAQRSGVVSKEFIEALVNSRPKVQQVSPGTEFVAQLPEVGFVRMKFHQDGSLVWTENGERKVFQVNPADFGAIIDLGGWLILSYLASRPFSLPSSDGKGDLRVDPPLLLELGTCDCVLRGGRNDPRQNAVLVHEVQGHGTVVCHKRGIVEPVTMAISHLLASDDPGREAWLRQAVKRKSFALMMRVYIALQQINSAYTTKAAWTKKMLDEIVKPALNAFPALH